MKLARLLVVTLAVVVAAALIWWWPGSQARIIGLMPTPLRTAYLDAVISSADPDGRTYELAEALRALEEDQLRGNSYRYDNRKLLRLVKADAYEEPIPALVCNVLLLDASPAVVRALSNLRRTDPKSVDECVEGALSSFERVWPERLARTEARIKSEPGLAHLPRRTEL